MILVRDPDTGEVLPFARGGRAERAVTDKRNLDLLVSDGVRSRPARVRAAGREHTGEYTSRRADRFPCGVQASGSLSLSSK